MKRRRAQVQADDAQQGVRKRARLEARARLKAGRAARRRAANPDDPAEPDDLDAPGTGERPQAADPAVSPPESAATPAATAAARPPAPPPGDGDDDEDDAGDSPVPALRQRPDTERGDLVVPRRGRAPLPEAYAPPPRAVAADLAPLLPPARPQRRHRAMLASFVLLVLLPFLLSGAYLWGVAQDQYASTFAFSVRKEETQSSLDIIGGITQLAGSATSDTDILYEFIRSQDLVARVNAELDLRSIWSRAWPDDPVFGFDPSGTIEDLHAHWLRKLDIAYDAGTGIVTLRVLAFDPVDARNIATAISRESTLVINALSEEARADATGQAREERDLAFARLRDARQAVTAFRLRTQIVDIESDLQGQMGLLNTLQAQLANTLIELDLQRETAPQGDPRVRQAERRIEVIEARIAAERAKFGEGGQGPGGEDYARIAAEFERLTVEREFAESTYRSALAAYEGALSSAQRQSRYLAVHIRPTLAERALYPQRVILCALVGFFLLVFWSMTMLVYYSVRDRK